jgi:hypothetical protein
MRNCRTKKRRKRSWLAVGVWLVGSRNDDLFPWAVRRRNLEKAI